MERVKQTQDMDKHKEKIEYLKLWLTFLVTIDAGSTAWLFQNLNKIITLSSIITYLFIILTTIVIGLIHRKIYKIIKNIGE